MTTPSGKKSGSQGRGKTGQSKTGQSKSGQSKSGQTKKPAAKPRTSSKGRRSKKKPGGRGVLLAFAAGLILASAAFWFLRDLSPSDFGAFLAGLSQQEETAQPSGAAPGRAESRQSQSAGKPAKSGAPSDRAGKETASPTAKQTATQTGTQAGKQSGKLSGKQAPAQPVPGSAASKEAEEEARREAARSSAVASALKELQDLPYEEPLLVSLDEHVRQMDYAVMQSAWQLKLPADALRLAAVEDRRTGDEHYRHQIIDVLPGTRSGSEAAFIKTLRSCLGKWAEGATVTGLGAGRWALAVNGVTTHELRLYPGRRAFPSGAPTLAPQEDKGRSLPLVSRTRPKDAVPKLVIVIDDLGASKSALNTLLQLDYPVTFAFWPHAAHTKAGAREAHAKGREVIVHLPMEPLGYPGVKPGPNVLLTGMDAGRIRTLTEAGIAAVPHATGLNNHMGSRFTQHAPGVAAVLAVLRERGLFMLDSLTHNRSVFESEAARMGVPHHRRNVFLDVEHSRAKVLEALRKAEKIAQLSGWAVAIGHPLPETLAALKDWQRLRNGSVRIVRLRDLPR